MPAAVPRPVHAAPEGPFVTPRERRGAASGVALRPVAVADPRRDGYDSHVPRTHGFSPARGASVPLLLVATVLAGAGCERLPTRPAQTAPGTVRGLTLVDWTRDGYGTAVADSAVSALAVTGANTVTLVVTAYQPNASARTLRPADPRTPAASAVRHALERASAAGLELALQPQVDLDDGTWRGNIAPPEPAAWFDSYRAFVLPWAALAESLGARRFVVGTELAGTVDEATRWRELIREVRGVFSGELVYAASWDEAGRVPFWSDLEAIGVDFYFPVATRADPGRLEALAGWQPWLDRLDLLHRQVGRPILLTEIGYRSVAGAGTQPYESGGAGPPDLTEQADLYWAALEACAGEPWIEGMSWWDWPADGSGGPLDTGYTPRGKPAETELRDAWEGAADGPRPTAR